MTARRRERTIEERWRALPQVHGYPEDLRQIHGWGRAGIRTVPDLVAAYGTFPRRRRARTLDFLSFLGDRRAVPLMIQAFDDPELRSTACRGLQWLGGRRAYRFARDTALEALDSPSPRIRRSAIDSVGMMKEKRALPRLEHIAAHDRSRLPILGSVAASARDTMRFLRTGSWVVDNSSTCQG